MTSSDLDATVERFYNSRSVYAHDFGNRWQAVPQTAARLYPQPNGDMVYYRDTVEVYRRLSATTFQSPSGANKTLTRSSSSGPFILTHHGDGKIEEFHPNGYIRAIKDRNGNTITITYDQTNNHVVSMRDTQGRTFRFDRNERNRVHTVKDPLVTAAQVSVQAGHQRADPLHQPAEPAHRLRLRQRGRPDQHQRRGEHQDRVHLRRQRPCHVAQLGTNDPSGPRTWTFEYLAGVTKVTDPRGNTTTYRYDPQARVTKVVDALGRERSTAYNANSNVVSYTDEVGGTPTRSVYDARNNLTKTTLPTGAASTFAYGATHPYYPTRYTSPQGNALTYDYDAKGNLAKVTDATVGAGATTMTYNANGTIASSTDPNGKQTTYGYDAKGNRTRVTPPAPMGETRYTYDTASRVTSVRDGNGHTTHYFYDVLDRVTRIDAHDGTRIVYEYDKVGKRTKQTDRPAGGTEVTGVSVFNRFGEVTREQRSNVTQASYTYDDIGNMASITDAGGTVSYTHNAVNLLTALVEPDGARTTFEYDARNNRRFTRYPNGVVQEGIYDASNRLTEITGRNAAGATLTRYAYTYTKAGTDTMLRHTVTDHTGATNTYDYDPLDRLTSVERQAGWHSRWGLVTGSVSSTERDYGLCLGRVTARMSRS